MSETLSREQLEFIKERAEAGWEMTSAQDTVSLPVATVKAMADLALRGLDEFHKHEWKTLETAPTGVPVTVWCNILNGPLGDEREWTAIQLWAGYWTRLGHNSRIHPTRWKPLAPPSER